MTVCGAALRSIAVDADTMEEASNRIVRYLYDNLVDKATGERTMALVRLFKTHPYGQIGKDLRRFARSVSGEARLEPDTKCLTLLASAGQEDEWNGRASSRGH